MTPSITGMEWNRQGITREVFLTRCYAIKIPKLVYGWRGEPKPR